MIQINSLTIKNFLSIGNITQSVNFSKDDLVLVLGENMDLGGNDNRNGVGKSSIVNALSYALYGEALTKIRKDNLINATNLKQMQVTVKFSVNGKGYTIIRGRRPNIFKFIEDGKESDIVESSDKDSDESQGEGRLTQEEIVRTIGISHSLFKHILALNTYVEPFLALRTSDQREIIEQLLGITKLSEKAEKLREETRITRDEIREEELRIAAVNSANKRIEQNILGLLSKSATWVSEKERKIADLQSSIMQFMSVDIESEIALHKSRKEVDDLTSEYRVLTKELTSLGKDVTDTAKSLSRLDRILSASTEKICPTCNQGMDKETHEKVHNEYLTQQIEMRAALDSKQNKYDETNTLAVSVKSVIPTLPRTFYGTVDEAYNHKTSLNTLGNSLELELASVNPYIDQISTLETDGLQEVDFTDINTKVKLREHQDFLLKLLTNKDSFIRKKIIDQNLSYLNNRLAHYLVEIGLPHTVKFKSDLEVEISMYGKEFDFDNLSRGERTRLILSLSWAFRDVYESMNSKINLMFIDELVDQGIDSAGTENVLKMLKGMARDGKNIYLITHREEFISRVSSVLKVVKENGFTTIELPESVV